MAKLKTVLLKKVVSPFNEFIHMHELSGYLLLCTTVISLVLANGPFGEAFVHFWHTEFIIGFAGNNINISFEHLINDGLMTIFFVVVGLEIKRELIEGELSSREKALLPVIGAVGGMLFPAIIFTFFNFGSAEASGWAIPTATDIAFSLTVISLLKGKVPLSLKIFLTALAIVDDLGAVVIIAAFYSSNIAWMPLLFAGITIAILIGMNAMDVRNVKLYLFFGLILWFCFLQSGIHATIAGVILALTVPFRFKNYEAETRKLLTEVQGYAQQLSECSNKEMHMLRDQIIEKMQKTSTLMEAPLNNLLYTLHGTSTYLVMPLFALANAGVIINTEAIANLNTPLSWGIILGLVFGKSFGITFTVWLSTKLKIAAKPGNVTWKDMYLTNLLAGIGFTMSIFITNLAFTDKEMIDTAKAAIIIASFGAGILGFVLLKLKKSIPASEE